MQTQRIFLWATLWAAFSAVVPSQAHASGFFLTERGV